MKPYSKGRKLKGISGCRKSKASPTRKRCLRTHKKAARQAAILTTFWEHGIIPIGCV